MHRRTAGTAAVALVAVLALALAAAGLPSSVLLGDGGSVGDGSGSGVGGGSGDGVGAADGGFDRPEWVATLVAIAFALLRVLGLLAILLLVALLVYIAVTRREELLDALRELLARVPFAMAQIVALGVFALLLLVLFPGGAVPESAPVVPFVGEGGGDSSASPSPPTLQPIVMLIVGLGLVIGSLLVLWGVRSRLGEASGSTTDAVAEGNSEDDDAEIEQAAGRAADRLESNEAPPEAVVAAWREMARRIGGRDRRTMTPRQFMTRAVAAGLDPDDVRTLTRLFEEVRYGNVELTDEQEQRAVQAFRRIEAADADSGSEG